jgi:hypothetical protein
MFEELNKGALMKKSLLILVLMMGFRGAAFADFNYFSARGCATNAQDRTIHLCDPAGSTLGMVPLIRAYAASASEVTSFQLWMDGVKQYDTASFQGPGEIDRATIDRTVKPTKPGWHRLTFIAKDALGEFRKSAYYFMTSTVACRPSSDRTIKICNGLKDRDTVTSPVHIVFATRDSTWPIAGIGIEGADAEKDGDYIPVTTYNAAGYYDSSIHMIGLSATVHLKPGQHTIFLKAWNAEVDWGRQLVLNVVQ